MVAAADIGPVAYLAGEYPKVSHTFIAREIAALRAAGVTIHTCSIRTTPARELGDDQRDEAMLTFAVLPAASNPLRLIATHLILLLTRPGAWFRTLGLAMRTGAPGFRARLWQVFYFLEAAVLARHMRRLGVRHLHNHFSTGSCTVAMLASGLSGIPFSFTMHGPDVFFEPRRWRIDEKIARAAFVVCISDFTRSQAMLFCDRRHWDRLHVVHCGIDPTLYAGDSRARDGAPVLFVGRLAAMKGVPILFEALALLRRRHPRLRLRLIGDGPDRAMLVAEAERLGLTERIAFEGYRTSAEVAAAMADCALLVLPSFAEGLPVVLMEAMASARPVVASRVGGIAELVGDGITGHVVAPGDPQALAIAIADILADPENAAAMGAAGRDRVVADHDAGVEAARLLTLLQAVGTGDRPPRRPPPLAA